MKRIIYNAILSYRRRAVSMFNRKQIASCLEWIPAFAGMTILLSFPAMAIEEPTYIFNISYEDAQEAIGKALTEKLSADVAGGKPVSVVINGKKSTSLYSSNKPVGVEVRGLRTEDSLNRWSASMVILSEDKVVSAMPLAGKYMVMNEVPVLKRSLRSGEVIGEADIEIKSFPQDRLSKDTVADAGELIGRSPIRFLPANRPLRSGEISAPSIIKKNALIQMRYKTPSMEITTSGQALADGAKGDVIEVRNVSSKKITRAVVAESNIVDVIGQGTETSQIIPVSASGAQIYAK